jgi:hypothetical protein
MRHRRGIHEKRREIVHDQRKLSGSMVDIGNEGCPLSLLQGIFSKSRCQRLRPILGIAVCRRANVAAMASANRSGAKSNVLVRTQMS